MAGAQPEIQGLFFRLVSLQKKNLLRRGAEPKYIGGLPISLGTLTGDVKRGRTCDFQATFQGCGYSRLLIVLVVIAHHIHNIPANCKSLLVARRFEADTNWIPLPDRNRTGGIRTTVFGHFFGECLL
jgi:hypothetical protein